MPNLEEELAKAVRAFAIVQLNQLAESDDLETAHQQADQVLCNLLVGLGYEDVVEAWRKVGKWYA